MPETPALIPALVALASAVLAGALLHCRLTRLTHRLPDEAERPLPSSWWVIPATVWVTALVWWTLTPGHPLIVPAVYTVAVWTMVPLAFIDLDVQRLPDRIQLPAYPVLAVLLAACSLATGDWGALVRALLAGVALFAFFLVMAILPGGGIGFGDVKLAGLLGMLLGWLSWGQVMWTALATLLIGGVVALLLLTVGRKGAREEFAYGPSMLLGALVALAAPPLLRALAG